MSTRRDFNAEFADNTQRKYHYEFDTFAREMLMQRLSPFFRLGDALEIGAFEGVMTRHLESRFRTLTVVEASSALAERLAQNFPNAEIINQRVEDWETDTKFSDIFLVHTLEHIDNRNEVLRKLHGLLTEDGYAYIAVPNANALSRQIAVEMGIIESTTSVTEGERAHGHTVTFNSESFAKELIEAGLKIVSRGGIVLKPLSNGQLDSALEKGVISREYLEACDRLSAVYPEFSSSIYAVVGKG